MTNAPNPGNEPDPTSGNQPQQASTRVLRRRQQQRIALFIGVVLLAGVGGGLTWTWFFIQQQLGPTVEQTLSKILNRPVKLGRLESFSLNGLRFGSTKVPATPTDPDRADIEAVDVSFNLVPLLLHRTLPLDVTLVKPNVYIQQDKDGTWVNAKLQTLPKGAIDIKLEVLRLRNADVVLVPKGGGGNPKTPVALKIPSGKARFLNNNKLIPFDLEGQLVSGGNFAIKGESRLSEQRTNLVVSGSNLGAAEIGRLLQLPLILQAGKLAANLEVKLEPAVGPLKLTGTATLNQVTARVPQLPKPFAKTNGLLRFKETQVRLEKVTTLFGQIPAQANGVVDTQAGFNLAARTQPIALSSVLQTFNIPKLPVVTSGEVQAALRVTGPLSKPVVTGEFANTKLTQIDRVNFRTVSAGFNVADSILTVNNLRATPTVGGLVTGRGQVQLGQKGSVRFDAQATGVPGDAIAKIYGLKLPVPIGLVSGNTQIVTSLDNPQNNLRATGSGNFNVAGGTVRATNIELRNRGFTAQVEADGVRVERLAQVPPQLQGPLSGRLNLSGSLASLSPSTIRGSGSGRLNVAGGTVRATSVELRNGGFTAQVEADGVRVERLAQLPPQLQGPLSGNFNLSGSLTALSPSTIRGSGSGRLNVADGIVRATSVELRNGNFTAQVEADGVRVERLAQLPPQIRGPLSGNFGLSGKLASLSPSTIRGSGSGRLNVAGGTVTATNVQLANGRFTVQGRASDIQVERLAQVPPQIRGPLSGNFDLSGNLASLSPSTISGNVSGRLDVAGGTVTATNVRLENGRFRAQGRADAVQVERLAQVPPQIRGPLSGNFDLSGNLASLNPSAISGNASGSLNVAGGTITATNVRLENGRFRAQGRAEGVQVQRLAQVPPQVQGSLSGSFELSGNLASLSPSTISGTASGNLNVAGGTITATNARLENGRFQAVVEPTGVQLASFSQGLRGSLGGRLNVSGSLAALSPSAIQANGQLNFSEGLAVIDRPLTASINWNGQQLAIQQATAEGFNANGVVNVNLANQGLQAIRSFDLNVQAKDLNLQQLPATLPTAANVVGRADFDGRIAGTVSSPNVNGAIALRDFALDGLKFESPLTGTVATVPGQQLTLNLNGANDQIYVALSPNYQPNEFRIKRGEAIASGIRQGDWLRVNAEKFPIAILRDLTPVPVAIKTQPLSGEISGNLEVNLNTFEVSLNQVALTGPIFTSAKGDQSQPGNNRYLLSGRILRTATGPQFQNIQLNVEQGEISVVLAALQTLQLVNTTTDSRSFNTASNGFVAPVNLLGESIEIQLRRLAELQALAGQRQQSENAALLPDLTKAQGQFTGKIDLNGSLASGITATVNIQGKDWKLDTYQLNEVSIVGEGSLQNGVLTLLPLRIQSGDSLISYAGTIGGEAQSGQLTLVNIPIDELQPVLRKIPNLPPAIAGLSGLLNATATVSGSINNPQARGVVTLDIAAEPNQTSEQQAEQIQRVLGSFSYANARLNFGSGIQIAGAESSSISGSIPYKLPIAKVEPTDNKFNLNINVKNEGLALLNLLAGGQVTWVKNAQGQYGTGNVQLNVNGIYEQKTNKVVPLYAKGEANIQNATLQARALPEGEPLTNVSANVLFNLDNIQVTTAQAQYSGGGITAAGTIPIAQATPQEQPLAVNIGELAINLKGLYRGGVQGGVVITGTALAPKIAGKLNLFNGQVSVAQQTATAGGGGAGGEQASTSPIEFNGLELVLGKGVQITQPPIANFLASGTLTINGPLGNLSPDGTIRLERGQVNLFTTQFRLARGYENTARFVPKQGLDPTLDVRLQALVTESTQRRLPNDPFSAEISEGLTTDLAFGRVRTVRVQARVNGPASQLADRLELTSTPPRSKSEIVALLGGSFVDTLGRGDSTLGLANLAGSALLSNFQSVIGDALGLSEFRLFPTIITSDAKGTGSRSSSLGLSAEAGVDVSRNFSVSVLKELTTDQPFQYSLRYRLNNETLLRGFSDFSGNSGAIVEYERRF
jgi:translocation and assembly module TamB